MAHRVEGGIGVVSLCDLAVSIGVHGFEVSGGNIVCDGCAVGEGVTAPIVGGPQHEGAAGVLHTEARRLEVAAGAVVL